VQKICDQALDELEACDRSKLQLTLLFVAGALRQLRCLCCLRHALAAPFQWLGGGPLGQPARCWRYKNLSPLNLPRSGALFPEMFPPGDIVYLRPVTSEWNCWCCERDVEWLAMWADPEDVQQEFILSTRVIELHVPWVYEHAIECVSSQLLTAPGQHSVKPFGPSRLGGRRPA